MTRIEAALQALYGHSFRDLTSAGYSKALHKLRKTDPTTARRMERLLEPVLAGHTFPRKKRKWQQTFEGTRARLALLPDNPHLRQDIIAIRATLGIPSDHVKATPNDPAWQQVSTLVKPHSVRTVLEGNLAGAWHIVHCQAFLHKRINTMGTGNLPSPFVESAISSAQVNLKAANVPSWLQKPPSGHAPYDANAAPVDWAAGRLVERHRLPWHTASNLAWYVITENSSFLKGIEPFEINVKYGNATTGDSEVFGISLNNLDEFVTKKDWDRVWHRIIKPRQAFIWEQRGTQPQGRRSADITRLKDALPLYSQVIERKKTMAHLTARSWDVNMDPETVRRALIDLADLLKPVA